MRRAHIHLAKQPELPDDRVFLHGRWKAEIQSFDSALRAFALRQKTTVLGGSWSFRISLSDELLQSDTNFAPTWYRWLIYPSEIPETHASRCMWTELPYGQIRARSIVDAQRIEFVRASPHQEEMDLYLEDLVFSLGLDGFLIDTPIDRLPMSLAQFGLDGTPSHQALSPQQRRTLLELEGPDARKGMTWDAIAELVKCDRTAVGPLLDTLEVWKLVTRGKAGAQLTLTGVRYAEKLRRSSA